MLLDFDGTVVDTMEWYADAASRIIEEVAGIPREEARRLYLATAGRPFREQLRLMGLRGEALEAAASRFEEEKRAMLRRVTLSPEVERFAARAREMGLQVFLSTNNECSVVSSNPQLTRVFDGVLCHDPETGMGKGEPHVKALGAMLGVRRCEILFIGDSDYDIELHAPLGVTPIRTRGLWRPGEAERLLEKIGELLDDP